MGRRAPAVAWLAAEGVAALLLAYLVIGLSDTTWYLVAFAAGIAFIAAWGGQAVLAYGHARRAQGAIGPTPVRSPAAAIAWLSLPLLVWGTGFWLVAAGASSPASVLDAFESSWPGQLANSAAADPSLRLDPATEQAAGAAIRSLQALCADGQLSADCAQAPANLLRDVRFRIASNDGSQATAVVEVVDFQRRPSRFLGLFPTTDLVPVARQSVLTLQLRAEPAPLPGGIDLGAQRWRIVNAAASRGVPVT